ncbi:MAG: hypothetical protein LBN21_06690 [Treponema sp.]|jgi:hypothetical protein|nr:hypothetical protein [Treponema sp.]
MRLKIRRAFWPLCLTFLFLCIFAASCGMDEYVYLGPVPEGNVTVDFNNRAVITLPSISGESTYFTHFAFYYRIYVSNILNDGKIPSDDLGSLNPAMQSDYSYIYPYSTANSSSTLSTNTTIGTILSGRGFYEFELEGANIRNELNPSNTVEIFIDTAPGSHPALTTGSGTPYPLYRSTGEGTFTPAPDRYFNNSSDLNSAENATATKNADVAKNTSPSFSEDAERYTYISLYIAKVGIDPYTYAYIYSTPTFIGILRLRNFDS